MTLPDRPAVRRLEGPRPPRPHAGRSVPDRQRPLGAPPAMALKRPHKFDPDAEPELFQGVLARRMVAFLVDVCIVLAPMIVLWVMFAILGVLTLGLGWMLFWLIGPAALGWALLYTATTLGGPYSATVGMRMHGLEMRTWYGAPVYPLLACVRLLVFFIVVSVLTPAVLLLGLFNGRRRLLHDFICGTVVINTVPRSVELVIRR
ncbi:RDD family protein [Blastochloris tepida]|jgi:uncharacterized RDD family membrane protein YckC|uniref:RDD family protein n=2 Tax=Blastochloris tepida TaxID=2233851 RepID=A0A348G0Z9_9HYPH|nr:RDD family protein [Blastochloris tepida]